MVTREVYSRIIGENSKKHSFNFELPWASHGPCLCLSLNFGR